MENQSAKRMAKRRRGDGTGISIDRLSELPQTILHYILSLLSQKEAVQTCVLSKSWRFLWHGRSNVEFTEESLKKEIWPFLDKTLQRYHEQNLSIRQFLVESSLLDSGFTLPLEKWIPRVILNMGVRALTLKFDYGHHPFSVPLVVFQTEFLVELDLRGCRLNQIKSTDKVLCKHLQTMRLHDVRVEEETFEKIMSSCPLIENLDLETCHGLTTIKLNNAHNLKHFGCSYHEPSNKEIESPCVVESIRISYSRSWFHHHNKTFFPHLKSLNLWEVELSEESFDSFSSNFPCLSELTLDRCDGLEDFLVTSCSMKRLIIKLGLERIKALIDTPNILYFECSGSEYGFLPSIKFKPTTKFEWKSHISVGYKLKPSDRKDATRWFRELSELLQGLSQSRISLNFHHQRYTNLNTPLHIKHSFGVSFKPVVVDTLRLSGYFISSSVPSFLDCFFRIFRPRYILMNQYASEARAQYKKENNRLAEFICKLIPKEIVAETGQNCYFWLQDLEEVSTQVWDMKAKVWLCVQGKSLPALPKKQEEQRIWFRLKWKDQLDKSYLVN